MRTIPKAGILLATAMGAAVTMLAVTALAGWSATPSHLPTLTGAHLSTCTPNPNAVPAIIGVNFHNTLPSPVTVIGGTADGSNIIPGQSWVLGAIDHSDSVDSGLAPFSQILKWSTRQPVGKVLVEPGDWVQVAVSFSFRDRSAIGAEVDGLRVTYRTADGSSHTATSTTKASYEKTCGS